MVLHLLAAATAFAVQIGVAQEHDKLSVLKHAVVPERH
jgi:hypothetical protein